MLREIARRLPDVRKLFEPKPVEGFTEIGDSRREVLRKVAKHLGVDVLVLDVTGEEEEFVSLVSFRSMYKRPLVNTDQALRIGTFVRVGDLKVERSVQFRLPPFALHKPADFFSEVWDQKYWRPLKPSAAD